MANHKRIRQRFVAWLIDLLIVLGVGGLFHTFGWLVSAGYWLLRDGLFEGQSVGKRLMGLRVIVLPARTRCTFRESIIRNVLWVVPVINLVMGAVAGYYVLLTTGSRRHWGDRLANTRVVRVSSQEAKDD